MRGTGPLFEGSARAAAYTWRAVCALALLGTLWFIFSHSAQPAAVSGAQSRGVLAFVNQALRGWGLPGVSEHLLRKRVARWTPWLWGAGILCAAADEGIQFFVPGRSARISDVLLDGCGVLAGLVLARAAIWAWTRLHGRAEERR